MAPQRALFTKSVVAQFELPAGTVLQKEHLSVKKPGTGIPARELSELIGRTLRVSVKANQVLQQSDIE
jgi:sialic acid synthase SpsE